MLKELRRELSRGEMENPETAIVLFTRKLGDALVRLGDAAEAEGVLREVLADVPRGGGDWVRVEAALSRALLARGQATFDAALARITGAGANDAHIVVDQ